MIDSDIDLQDEGMVNELLKKARAVSFRIVEKRNIQPVEHAKAGSKNEVAGPNWVELMPTTPGMTVKPAKNAKKKRVEEMQASAIRKPGYDSITKQEIAAVVPPPPIPAGGVNNSENQVMGGGSAVNPGQSQSASSVAKDSNPGLQRPQ